MKKMMTAVLLILGGLVFSGFVYLAILAGMAGV